MWIKTTNIWIQLENMIIRKLGNANFKYESQNHETAPINGHGYFAEDFSSVGSPEGVVLGPYVSFHVASLT